MREKRTWRPSGAQRHAEYWVWRAMKQRCYLPKHPSFPNYGGRGIIVCDKWRHSFLAFIDDVGWRPGPKYSISRIDNDGNYEPGNVAWSTKAEQMDNRRCTLWVVLNGERRSLASCAREHGTTPKIVMGRIELGWSLERALQEPVSKRGGKPTRWLTVDGERKSLMEWARSYSIEPEMVWGRVKRGWPPERALTMPARRG